MRNLFEFRLLKSGVHQLVAHPQLFMTVILVIIVPIAFVFSGQQFLSAARENQERLEKDRVGMMHDLLASLIVESSFDSSRIKVHIDTLATLNPDITKLNVAREEGNEIKIIASLHGENTTEQAPDSELYRIANASLQNAIITPTAHDGIRYWQSFRVVRVEGYPVHYIYIETSLEHIDVLFANRIIVAYYWLFGIIAIVLFLVVRHVRLIDYAYLYRETKRAIEIKDLFTNMIAHELRAPLTAMRGYASMIREDVHADEVIKTRARYIEDGTGRLLTIVSDLLDVARIQSGKMRMEKKSVDISSIVREVIETQKAIADAKGISIEAEGAHVRIDTLVDEKRLFQVLTNLINNAIKYTPAGTIRVSIKESGNRIEVRVKDTGMGISSEDQKKLFAPFFRVESADVSKITGTGLGMWITKQLIDLMGGSIGVESIRGVGTHVVVTLPHSK